MADEVERVGECLDTGFQVDGPHDEPQVDAQTSPTSSSPSSRNVSCRPLYIALLTRSQRGEEVPMAQVPGRGDLVDLEGGQGEGQGCRQLLAARPGESFRHRFARPAAAAVMSLLSVPYPLMLGVYA